VAPPEDTGRPLQDGFFWCGWERPGRCFVRGDGFAVVRGCGASSWWWWV